MSTSVQHEHHVVGPKTYGLILLALLSSTTATTTGVAFSIWVSSVLLWRSGLPA